MARPRKFVLGKIHVSPAPDMDKYHRILDTGRLTAEVEKLTSKWGYTWVGQRIPLRKGAVDEDKLGALILKLVNTKYKRQPLAGEVALAPKSVSQTEYYWRGGMIWCHRTEHCDLIDAETKHAARWSVPIDVGNETMPVYLNVVVDHPPISMLGRK